MSQEAFHESQFVLVPGTTGVELDPVIASQIANEVFDGNNRLGGRGRRGTLDNNYLPAPATPIIIDLTSEEPSRGARTSRANEDETVGYHINMPIDPAMDSPTRYNSLFAREMLKALDSDERLNRLGVGMTLGFMAVPTSITLGIDGVALADNNPSFAITSAIFGGALSASVIIPSVHSLYRRAVTRPEATTLTMLRRDIAAHRIAKLGLEPMLKTE